MKGDDGLEFVEFAEGPTKTRPEGLSANSRQFQPKMFQTGEGKCPVALFRQYISRRPPNLRTSGPFYLSIKYNRRADDEIWYKVQPMGENKINSMMKSTISGTSLETFEKRFSNHSEIFLREHGRASGCKNVVRPSSTTKFREVYRCR